MCSTRIGDAPAGSTGTSTRRSRKALTSYSPAYASAPRPTALTAARPFTSRGDRAPGRRHDEQATSAAAWQTGLMSDPATSLKERLRTDLTTAIKDRDKVRSGTIRMVLSAISEAEVAGAEAIELTEQQVLDVVIREAKKRREAEEAYAAAGRTELAEKEQAESAVLADYLPQQLTAEEISDDRRRGHRQHRCRGAGPEGMGKVMGVVTPQTKGKADGARWRPRSARQLSRLAATRRARPSLLLLLLFSAAFFLARFSAATCSGSRPSGIGGVDGAELGDGPAGAR